VTDWRLFGVALVLPPLFTALVLLEVQRNRSGAGIEMNLTEREVTLSGDTGENSGTTAWVKWASEGGSRQVWLSPEQLGSLGFDLTGDGGAPGDRRRPRQLPRRAYIAFELRAGLPQSGLVPVDASLDRDEMTAKYPNRGTHLVVAGLVGLRRDFLPDRPDLTDGYVVNIDPRGIHVPPELAGRLRPGGTRRPTFTITVRYGSRLEPWVVDVR
jgi:hypothetical protein